MNEKDTLIRVLEAGGHDQAAAFARALLPDQPAPGPAAGATAPSADAAARMAAAAGTPAGQAALAASASGGHQSEYDYYDTMSQEQLAALPDAEFQVALNLLQKSR